MEELQKRCGGLEESCCGGDVEEVSKTCGEVTEQMRKSCEGGVEEISSCCAAFAPSMLEI